MFAVEETFEIKTFVKSRLVYVSLTCSVKVNRHTLPLLKFQSVRRPHVVRY